LHLYEPLDPPPRPLLRLFTHCFRPWLPYS
jgi:hypothetical protein